MRFTILFLIIFTSNFHLLAQAPNGFNYQGIATDINNNPLINKKIAFKLSILNAQSVAEYIDTLSNILTSESGAFNIIIGTSKTPFLGNFSSIDWSANKYLKVELDINNGKNYQQMGNPILLKNVPFAFQVNNAGNASQLQNIPISTSTPNNGDILIYNSTTKKWEPTSQVVYSAGTNINLNSTSTPIIRVLNSAPNIKIAYLREERSSGISGGNLISNNTFITRILNTLIDPLKIGVTLDSTTNRFTLPAGNYQITVDAPFYNNDGKYKNIFLALKNITDNQIVDFQQSSNGTKIEIRLSFTVLQVITAPKTYEIQYKSFEQSNEPTLTNGLGIPCMATLSNTGMRNIYTKVRIVKF